jgi:STE24 endopeptidase
MAPEGILCNVKQAPRVALALVAAAAAAEAAVVLLRPRNGIIEPVHVEAESYFTAAQIERARAYRRPQLVLFATSSTIEVALLAWLAARPERLPRQPAVAGAAVSVGLAAVQLPLGAISHRRARAVGLATQGWRGWARDVARARALSAGFAAAGGAAAVALVERRPDDWWRPGTALVLGLAVAGTYLSPVVIDPIFNHFEPMPDGETRRDVLDLARRAGVEVGEVYVADASRRTTAVNAYVTGIGRTKRVVLFDTLLDGGFSRDEVRLVVAHELAHVRHRDVPRGLAFMALVTPAGLYATAQLAPRDAAPASLPGLALAAGAVGAVVGAIGNRLSRAVERRADSFSLQQTGGVEAFVGFETGIVLRNVADPDPPRLLHALLSTHPTTLERIGIAKGYEAGNR